MTATLVNPPDTANDNHTGPSTALLTCCALAWHGNALAGLDMNPDYARRIARTTLDTATHTELLAWRSNTPPASWDLRWNWALRILRLHFTSLPGIADIPRDHHALDS